LVLRVLTNPKFCGIIYSIITLLRDNIHVKLFREFPVFEKQV
jgi:hypothetical protein